MSQSGVDIKINFARELQQASAVIQATPKQLQLAGGRAIKKTMRWLKTRIARELAASIGVSQKVLKSRIWLSHAGSGYDAVTIFGFGTAPMAVDRMGNARQTKAGVSLRDKRYKGAFYRNVYGDGDKVWIRKSRANALGMNLPKLDSYNTARGGDFHFLDSGGANDSSQRGRFPIVRIGVDIADVSAEVFKRFQARIPEEFRKILAQELNYVVNHER